MNDEADDCSLFDFYRAELRQGLGAITLAIERLDTPEAGAGAVTEIVEVARSLRGASRIVGLDLAARLAAAIEESASGLVNHPPAGTGASRAGHLARLGAGRRGVAHGLPASL